MPELNEADIKFVQGRRKLVELNKRSFERQRDFHTIGSN